MKTLAELQILREKLVRRREIERRVADQDTITEERTSVEKWRKRLAEAQAASASTLLSLEQQLEAAKRNREQSINFHTTGLKNAEERLRLALQGENKKTKKISAEIEVLDKEIALAKAKESGDTSEIDSIIQTQVEKSKKLLAEMANLNSASAPPPPAALSESPPAPPPPPALSEDEEEAKRLAAKAAAIAEDKEATKAAQSNPIQKIFPGATLVQESKKKKPVKTATSATG